MTSSQNITASLIIALLYFVTLDFVPHGGLIFIIVGVALLAIGLHRGTQLPLMLRAFITTSIFYWGSSTFLIGRTMEPGLSSYTVGMAFATFCLYGIWPAFALFRLWRSRVAVVLACLLVPVGFALAAAMAGTEEYLFVRKYQNSGIGPTARWTVSMHWLSYDRETQQLHGSD